MGPQHFVKVYSRMRPWFLDMAASSRPNVDAPLHPVDVWRIKFRNDLGPAAGLDKNGELLAFNYLMGAGFGVVGTVLSHPYKGNLKPAYGKKVNPWTPLPNSKSAINTLGLPSAGVDAVVRNICEFQDTMQPVDFPIVANIMGHPKQSKVEKLEWLGYCARKLLPVVDVIEDNESCPNSSPNTKHEEEESWQKFLIMENNLRTLVYLRDEHYAKTGKYVPIIVKLAEIGLNANDAFQNVRDLNKNKVDGVVLTNTQKDYVWTRANIDPKDWALFDYYTSRFEGGVSGKAIAPFSHLQARRADAYIKMWNSDLKVVHELSAFVRCSSSFHSFQTFAKELHSCFRETHSYSLFILRFFYRIIFTTPQRKY